MVFLDNYHILEFRGKPKGIEQILRKRGLWDKKYVVDCSLCKDKITQNDLTRIKCYAWHIISLQPDFLAQKCALQELVEEADHVCIFYPKFHCELNFIEWYWGAAKRFAWENCNYSWAGLKQIVPRSLESVNLITIQKFARYSWHYIDLYGKGITGKLAEYAVKKYKSHRRIPDHVIEELNKITL